MKRHDMIKKWLICAAVLLCLMLPFSAALADTENVFSYFVSGESAIVTGYSGTETDIVIPDTLGGYPVTQIRYNAFMNMGFTSVTLPQSLTQIGDSAFSGCTSLSAIVIPDNVTFIDDDAFHGCTSLTSVKLGNNLSTIDTNTFYGCTSLTKIVIPDSVTNIYDRAFYGCTALSEITLPQNINYIGSNAFYNCPAPLYATVGTKTAYALFYQDYIFIDTRVQHFTYDYYNTGWQITSFDGSITDVIIPEGFNSISSNVFKNNTALTSVSFPSTLTEIGSSAFYGCTGLTSVSFPSTLTNIGWNAFQGCTGLTSINIPGSVKTIERSAFEECLRLTSVTLNEGLEMIDSSAFDSCTNLPSIDIPASVKIIDYNAFYNCLSLASVTLHEGLEEIGSNAFYRCLPLKEITLPSTLKTFSGGAFRNTAIKEVILPENITSISGTDDNIRYYVDKDSVTAQSTATKPNYSIKPFSDPEWPELAFYYLINEYTGEKSLQLYKYYGRNDVSVTIPDFIAGIYQYAFDQYNSNFATTENTVLQEIIVPDSVTTIGYNAFTNCNALKRIYLPDNITSIGNYIAETNGSAAKSPVIYCSKDSATAKIITPDVYRYGFTDPDDPEYGLAYDTNGGLVLSAYHGKDTALTLPSGITAIGENAFYQNKTIQSVVIPEGVTEIRYSAFYDCTALANVTLPSTLKSIAQNGFQSCALTSVTLPDSVTYLGSGSFRCSNLEEIYLPDNITTVDGQAFYDITLIYCKKGSTTAYSVSAESTSYRLCDPADPDWKYRYNDDGGLVFGGYRGSKTELTIPNIYVGISDYALSGNETLKKIYVPDSVTSLGYSALSGNLEEIYLPDGITEAKSGSLGWGSDRILFINKNSQTMNTLLALGDEFTFCDPSDPDWLWQYDEDGTLMLGGYRGKAKSITLPSSVSVIAEDAFYGNRGRGILSVTIPEGYTTISKRAFGYSEISHFSLPSTLQTIDEEALDGCDISSIQLPEGLEFIGKYAFDDCFELTSLTIPSSVTRIDDPLVDDSRLINVVLPAEIEYIAPGAFGDSLSTVYCYRNTYAQTWAKANSPLVKLIGSGTLEGLVKLSIPEYYQYDPEYFVFEVGNSYPFMSGVSLGTLPIDTNYTFTCKSSNTAVANVVGDMVTFLKPGKATLTIGIAERPDVTPLKRTIEVYNPVTSFTVPEAVFVHIDAQDKPTYVMPENIEPASNANPYFRRAEEDGWWEWCNTTDRGIYFWPYERLGAQKGYIESMSGIRHPILFVTYDKIGEVYANAPARPLVIGQVWAPDVTVMVDGAELDKLSYLYTLKTSNSRVAAITEDEMIRAVAPGTATITVTARNSGRTAKFTVTVTEAVTLHLPAALKAVSDEAFIAVSAGEIVIPDGCTEIGARAFADCANLYEVTIPASVSTIADDAFEGCADVNIIAPEGSAGQAAAEANSANGFTFTAM